MPKSGCVPCPRAAVGMLAGRQATRRGRVPCRVRCVGWDEQALSMVCLRSLTEVAVRTSCLGAFVGLRRPTAGLRELVTPYMNNPGYRSTGAFGVN